MLLLRLLKDLNFYPRPPGGGRHGYYIIRKLTVRISIHALRVEGDYKVSPTTAAMATISIHALRVEGDY